MADHDKHQAQVDPATGVADTGHEWDGIRELNNPLPRWWLWTFYATIVWAIGYWILYPAWPLLTDATRGISGWSSRTDVVEQLNELNVTRGELGAQLASAELNDVVASPDLLGFAQAQGKAAFATNCAPCHGTGASGSPGYPNLNDDDWIWGGTLTDIEYTLRHGIRSGAEEARVNNMPAFGRDAILPREDLEAVTDFVRSLAKLDVPEGANLDRGREIFGEQCVACHGDEGKGNAELGAPNLTDAIWLYGSDRAQVYQSVFTGRGGVMPHWGDRLDNQTIKALTVYVHSLGGGQ
ncbi:cytochrome-c oxidase, cbb3-type subunit III [Terrihabitans sp. B22-R8]|uniref:cytochrome-c oxidase, cbb3-type subunit III n=1 Tax=Terrihabitans sp. B22-R8 TaxID=3425128 RepID=UPI00403CC56F